jgi:hypothetical protein
VKRVFYTIITLASFVVITGCKPDECRQMQACCDEVKGEPGMGQACGDLAQNVTKPETCRSVVQTVSYMYVDRGLELPAACKVAAPAQ